MALIALLLVLICLPWIKLGLEVAALDDKLPKASALTIRELFQVVSLAHQAGMKKVAEIGPQSGGLVDVFTPWIVEGRRRSRDVLTIGSDTRVNGFQKDSDSIRRGAFWTYGSGKLSTEHWATFAFHGRDTQIRCSLGSDLSLVDRVLAKLESGAIAYATPEVTSKAVDVKFNNPSSLWSGAGGVWISFRTQDRGCWYLVQFKFEGETLMIVRVDHLCE